MTEKLVICGLALPYDVPTTIRGVRETVAPWAVSRGQRPVSLLCGDHVGVTLADTSCGSLQVFNYREGLGFRAAFDWSHPSAIWMSRALRAERWGASVMFAQGWDADEWEADGQRHRRIHRAEIEHVSIVTSPAYPTAVWPAEMPTSEMSADLARVVARWDIGARALDQDHQRRPCRSAAGAKARGRTGHLTPHRPIASPPPSLVALMASPDWRQAEARGHAAAAHFAAFTAANPGRRP